MAIRPRTAPPIAPRSRSRTSGGETAIHQAKSRRLPARQPKLRQGCNLSIHCGLEARMENYTDRVNYFCVGLGIGAVAGLLLAPKPGANTREEIGRKFEEGK